MTTYLYGPPGGMPPCYKNARGDLPAGTANLGRAPCASPVYVINSGLPIKIGFVRIFCF